MIALSLRDSGVRVVFTDRFDAQEQVRALFDDEFEPARVHQVHGASVISIDDGRWCRPLLQADGIYIPSDRSGVAGIATADCLPLVVANHNGDVVVLHVGWRGLAAGVVEAGLARLGGNGLIAVIGPHIRSCCYQFLGPERYIIEQRFGVSNFVGENLSMEHAVSGVLDQHGIREVLSVGQCTFCNDSYHSYRRDGTVERQLTLAASGGR
ncbi:MAG: polyphenol oxidase family protein [Ferrimicrobium sp.]